MLKVLLTLLLFLYLTDIQGVRGAPRPPIFPDVPPLLQVPLTLCDTTTRSCEIPIVRFRELDQHVYTFGHHDGQMTSTCTLNTGTVPPVTSNNLFTIFFHKLDSNLNIKSLNTISIDQPAGTGSQYYNFVEFDDDAERFNIAVYLDRHSDLDTLGVGPACSVNPFQESCNDAANPGLFIIEYATSNLRFLQKHKVSVTGIAVPIPEVVIPTEDFYVISVRNNSNNKISLIFVNSDNFVVEASIPCDTNSASILAMEFDSKSKTLYANIITTGAFCFPALLGNTCSPNTAGNYFVVFKQDPTNLNNVFCDSINLISAQTVKLGNLFHFLSIDEQRQLNNQGITKQTGGTTSNLLTSSIIGLDIQPKLITSLSPFTSSNAGAPITVDANSFNPLPAHEVLAFIPGLDGLATILSYKAEGLVISYDVNGDRHKSQKLGGITQARYGGLAIGAAQRYYYYTIVGILPNNKAQINATPDKGPFISLFKHVDNEIIENSLAEFIIVINDISQETLEIIINWGDNSPTTVIQHEHNSQSIIRPNHIYDTAGQYIARVDVNDATQTFIQSLNIKVQQINVAPTIPEETNFIIQETRFHQQFLELHFVDPNFDDVHTYSALIFPDDKEDNVDIAISYATAIAQELPAEELPKLPLGTVFLNAEPIGFQERSFFVPLPLDFTKNNRKFSLFLQLTDNIAFVDFSAIVEVQNVRPLLKALEKAVVGLEGGSLKFDVEFDDPGDDTWKIFVNWKDTKESKLELVEFEEEISSPVTIVSPVFEDNFEAEGIIEIVDSDDSFDAMNFKLIVNNASPKIEANSVQAFPKITLQPEQSLFVSGVFSDPGKKDTHEGTLFLFQKKESVPFQTKSLQITSNTFSVPPIQMSVVGQFDAIVEIVDNDEATGSLEFSIDVASVPAKLINSEFKFKQNFEVDFKLAFEFLGDFRFTVEINWGDVVEQLSSKQLLALGTLNKRERAITAGSTLTIDISHAFSKAGNFESQAKISDGQGGITSTPVSNVVISPDGFGTIKEEQATPQVISGIAVGPGANQTTEEEVITQPIEVESAPTVQQVAQPKIVTSLISTIDEGTVNAAQIQQVEKLGSNTVKVEPENNLFVAILSTTPIIVARDISTRPNSNANENNSAQQSNSNSNLVTQSYSRIVENESTATNTATNEDLINFSEANFFTSEQVLEVNSQRVSNINYTSLYGENGSVRFSHYIFEEQQTVTFNKQTFDVQPGTVKWSVELEGIDFKSTDSFLTLDYAVTSKNEVLDATVDLEKQEIIATSNQLQFHYSLPTNAIVDGVERENVVSYEWVQITPFQSVIRFTFPTFKTKLEYDPTFDVLFSGGENGGGSSSSDDEREYKIVLYLSIAAFGVAIIAVIVVIIIGLLFPKINYGSRKSKQKHLQRVRANRRKLSNNNNGSLPMPVNV